MHKHETQSRSESCVFSFSNPILKVVAYSFRIVRVLRLKAQVIYLHLFKEKHLCTSIFNDININTKSKTDSEFSGFLFPPSKLGRLVVNILHKSELVFREISKTFLAAAAAAKIKETAFTNPIFLCIKFVLYRM